VDVFRKVILDVIFTLSLLGIMGFVCESSLRVGGDADGGPYRKIQIHLSTAMVLIAAAGGLLGAAILLIRKHAFPLPVVVVIGGMVSLVLLTMLGTQMERWARIHARRTKSRKASTDGNLPLA
jgi:hypothetical protein